MVLSRLSCVVHELLAFKVGPSCLASSKSMGNTRSTERFTIYSFFATFVWNFSSVQLVLKLVGLRNLLPCHHLSHWCWFGFCFLHSNFSWNSVNPQVCHTTLLSLRLMLVSLCSFLSLFHKGLGSLCILWGRWMFFKSIHQVPIVDNILAIFCSVSMMTLNFPFFLIIIIFIIFP